MADGEREEAERAGEEAATAFVVQQMRAGADEETIVARLVEGGAEPGEARRLVERVYPEVMRLAEEERLEPRALVPAALAGLAAAVAGGIAWALIVVATDYELGIAALGIGILAGFAVAFGARGARGRPLQVTAALASVLGIVLGKYFTYVWLFREAVREQLGEEAADLVSVFDWQMVRFFVEDAEQVFGGFDLLWAAFAVYSAWRIPRALGVRVRRGPITGL